MAHQLKGLFALALAAASAITVAYGAGGSTEGPSRGIHVIPTDGTHSFAFRFYAGDPARVIVSGDGDSDLDLTVRDQNSYIICEDTGNSDLAACEWTPRYTGRYTVRVNNIGMENRYWIITN